MKKTVLITGARAPIAWEWAAIFSQSGCNVVLGDSFIFPIGCFYPRVKYMQLPPFNRQPVRTVDAILDSRFDIVIPTCEEAFYLSFYKNDFPDSVLFSHDFELMKNAHDKYSVFQLFESQRIRKPQTFLIEKMKDLAPFLERLDQFVLKPQFSRFGNEAMLNLSSEKLHRLSFSRNYVLQQKIAGDEICSYTICRVGQVVSHISYRPVYRVGKGASIYFQSCPNRNIEEFVCEFAKNHHAHGQLAFDFIESPDGQIFLLECNPRGTSGIHLLREHFTASQLFKQNESRECFVNQFPQKVEPKMLGTIMVLLFPLLVFHNGFVRVFRDFFNAKDVLPKRIIPFGIISLAELVLRSVISLKSVKKISTDDICWNGNSIPEREATLTTPRAIIPKRDEREVKHSRWCSLLQEKGSEFFVKNAFVKDVLIEWENIPILVSEKEYGSTYVCSIYTTFISYAKDELRIVHGISWLSQIFLRGLIGTLAILFRLAKIDQVVSINNFLLSTNFYPELSNEQLDALIRRLSKKYPRHVLMFRSLNRKCNAGILDHLQFKGCFLIPSRQVFIIDMENGSFRQKKDYKNDLNLLKNTTLSIVKHDDFQDDDFSRIVELYNLLYVEKYSKYNPLFTEEFVRFQHCERLMEFFGLRNEQGVLVGIIACYSRGKSMTSSIVGYETSLPQELGLYRMLTVLAIQHAEKNKRIFNMSSGVGTFKRTRGAEKVIEFNAIYTKHLPLGIKKITWSFLRFLLNTFVLPMVETRDF